VHVALQLLTKLLHLGTQELAEPQSSLPQFAPVQLQLSGLHRKSGTPEHEGAMASNHSGIAAVKGAQTRKEPRPCEGRMAAATVVAMRGGGRLEKTTARGKPVSSRSVVDCVGYRAIRHCRRKECAS
jgi:hypothetical protein